MTFCSGRSRLGQQPSTMMSGVSRIWPRLSMVRLITRATLVKICFCPSCSCCWRTVSRATSLPGRGLLTAPLAEAQRHNSLVSYRRGFHLMIKETISRSRRSSWVSRVSWAESRRTSSFFGVRVLARSSTRCRYGTNPSWLCWPPRP